MLTVELLKQQPHLSGLTDEQLSAIHTLSVNDEEMTMKKRIGEWADRIEEDFLAASGIEKKAGEKYFEYIKRGAAKLKDNLSEQQAKVNALSKKLEEGVEVKDDKDDKRLQDALKRAEAMEQKYEQMRADAEARINQEKQEKVMLKSKTLIKESFSSMAPKAGLDKSTFEELIETRMNKFFQSYTPEEIVGDDGKEYVQFRDKNGEIYTNNNNLFKPFTASEIGATIISGLVEEKRVVTGTGTRPSPTQNASGVITGTYRSKADANEAFREFASSNGWAYGSPKYNEKYTEFREVNGIKDLPLTTPR